MFAIFDLVVNPILASFGMFFTYFSVYVGRMVCPFFGLVLPIFTHVRFSLVYQKKDVLRVWRIFVAYPSGTEGRWHFFSRMCLPSKERFLFEGASLRNQEHLVFWGFN